MESYLKPSTLFSPGHFVEYLNQVSGTQAKSKLEILKEECGVYDERERSREIR